MMSHPGSWLLLLLLVVGNAGSLLSQEVVTERPPTSPPTVVAAVASLSAMVSKGQIFLEWPAAAGASDYRVTRVDNTPGTAETTLFEGPWTNFVFEGKECTVTPVANTFKNCVFLDKAVTKNVLYSYRVWTGGGPSPVATAKAR
jgi:hypothetical protein